MTKKTKASPAISKIFSVSTWLYFRYFYLFLPLAILAASPLLGVIFSDISGLWLICLPFFQMIAAIIICIITAQKLTSKTIPYPPNFLRYITRFLSLISLSIILILFPILLALSISLSIALINVFDGLSSLPYLLFWLFTAITLLYFFAKWILSFPLCIIENHPPLKSLERSSTLIKNNLTCSITLLLTLAIITITPLFLLSNLNAYLFLSFALIFPLPFTIITLTTFYKYLYKPNNNQEEILKIFD